MKKIKLNSEKLILKKEKIASLTPEQEKFVDWIPVTTATLRFCCDLTDICAG
ncbi:hypothetical protein [Pedobacter cryoconitis]|uniref:Uncharacterized protein n=1 Tax=Pedobacter cryoconitis TaxID=188932 RepID=A0A7X0MJ91_9SPHI|nr:hypothetical protein [Pedobacter cryoconitis]MBB6500914.1 hypothetical protein [Pedobacter cryoconitis]